MKTPDVPDSYMLVTDTGHTALWDTELKPRKRTRAETLRFIRNVGISACLAVGATSGALIASHKFPGAERAAAVFAGLVTAGGAVAAEVRRLDETETGAFFDLDACKPTPEPALHLVPEVPAPTEA